MWKKHNPLTEKRFGNRFHKKLKDPFQRKNRQRYLSKTEKENRKWSNRMIRRVVSSAHSP